MAGCVVARSQGRERTSWGCDFALAGLYRDPIWVRSVAYMSCHILVRLTSNFVKNSICADARQLFVNRCTSVRTSWGCKFALAGLYRHPLQVRCVAYMSPDVPMSLTSTNVTYFPVMATCVTCHNDRSSAAVHVASISRFALDTL